MAPFANRAEAGRLLAAALSRFRDRRPVVLALARGGVAVGYELAVALHAPLDVVLVRKISHPRWPELAIGAIADGAQPQTFIDAHLLAELGIPREYAAKESARQARTLALRARMYFQDRAPADLEGCAAIVVDDGIATGASVRVALRAVRARAPAALVLAVPVAAAGVLEELRSAVDEVVCLEVPKDFHAVGAFYADFRAVEDATVVALLERAAEATTWQTRGAER